MTRQADLIDSHAFCDITGLSINNITAMLRHAPGLVAMQDGRTTRGSVPRGRHAKRYFRADDALTIRDLLEAGFSTAHAAVICERRAAVLAALTPLPSEAETPTTVSPFVYRGRPIARLLEDASRGVLESARPAAGVR